MKTSVIARIMALLCAISSVCFAQQRPGPSIDVSGTLKTAVSQHFGPNSPMTLLTNAYAPYIYDMLSSFSPTNEMTLNNWSGSVQSATISDATAKQIGAQFGFSDGIVFGVNGQQTITSTSMDGSKISWVITIGKDGKFKITYSITVKLNLANIVLDYKDNVVPLNLTPDDLKNAVSPIAPSPPETSPVSPAPGGGGSGGGSTPPGGSTGSSPVTTGFWETYQGPGSDYYAITHPGNVTIGQPISVAWE